VIASFATDRGRALRDERRRRYAMAAAFLSGETLSPYMTGVGRSAAMPGPTSALFAPSLVLPSGVVVKLRDVQARRPEIQEPR
jgi:hypothetical protein